MVLEPSELLSITTSYRRSHVIYALTSPGIPDALADGSSTPAEVAAVVGVRTQLVSRLLRAAASEGILDSDRRSYSLNPFSRQLCAGGDGSLRDMVLGWRALRI